MSICLIDLLVVDACAVFAACPVYADLAPAPGYVESCTLNKQQRANEECTMCSAWFGSREACTKLSAAGL
jgi:hypothetical protein